VPLVEEDAADAEAEEAEVLPESASDSMAEKRSCINFLNACRAWWVESVEFSDEEELPEVALEFVDWPSCGEGIEIPIWLNACMMLCIRLSFPPEFA
jgi:hypothetical protein